MEVDPRDNSGGEPVSQGPRPLTLLQYRNSVLGPYKTVKTLKDYAESAAGGAGRAWTRSMPM